MALQPKTLSSVLLATGSKLKYSLGYVLAELAAELRSSITAVTTGIV
jgi:hypothetical protein